jgi:hypothetical protein
MCPLQNVGLESGDLATLYELHRVFRCKRMSLKEEDRSRVKFLWIQVCVGGPEVLIALKSIPMVYFVQKDPDRAALSQFSRTNQLVSSSLWPIWCYKCYVHR